MTASLCKSKKDEVARQLHLRGREKAGEVRQSGVGGSVAQLVRSSGSSIGHVHANAAAG